jgi:hypothetical protein
MQLPNAQRCRSSHSDLEVRVRHLGLGAGPCPWFELLKVPQSQASFSIIHSKFIVALSHLAMQWYPDSLWNMYNSHSVWMILSIYFDHSCPTLFPSSKLRITSTCRELWKPNVNASASNLILYYAMLAGMRPWLSSTFPECVGALRLSANLIYSQPPCVPVSRQITLEVSIMDFLIFDFLCRTFGNFCVTFIVCSYTGPWAQWRQLQTLLHDGPSSKRSR